MTEETKQGLYLTISADPEGYGFETNMNDPEALLWLVRTMHKINLRMDETDTPA